MAITVRGRALGSANYSIKGLRCNKLLIFSGEVESRFQIETTDAKINPDWLLPSSAPDPFGIPCVGSSCKVEKSVAFVTYNYEGGSDSQGEMSESDYTVEIDTTMTEAPMEAHPDFETLKSYYGWDKEERRFPEYLPSEQAKSLPGSVTDGPTKSEAYGTESWLVPGAQLRVSFSGRTIPSWVMQGIGTITNRPQGLSKLGITIPIKRNWLKLGPKISERGNRYQISAEWMLSGPRGWIKKIYSSSQLT